MIEAVYIHTNVEKTIQQLQDQENTPAFAAKKAEQIIHSLAKGVKPARAGKLSRKGDARIKKCLKYDLGKGYRMVCVKERTAVYVLYTGSHDECHTWMDKHRNLKLDAVEPYLIRYENAVISSWCPSSNVAASDEMENRFPSTSPHLNDDDDYDYDDILMEKITQKDLRELFQGLTR